MNLWNEQNFISPFFFFFFSFLPADRHYVIYGNFICGLLEHNNCTQKLPPTPIYHSDNYPVMAGVWRRSASNLNQSSHSNHSHILNTSVTAN